MALLKPGVPVTQDTPHLLVENKLSPGRYRFQLVAIDSAGLESAPAQIVVQVNEAVKPTGPVIGPVLGTHIFQKIEAQKLEVKPVKKVLNPAILKNLGKFKPK